MVTNRRARPTIRCLTEDLGSEIPGLDVGIGDIEGAWLDELRRIAPVSPQGQKRILAIVQPVVYRLRVGSSVLRPGLMRGTGLCGCARCTAASRILTMVRTPGSLIFTRRGGCSRRRMTGCAIARKRSSVCSGAWRPGCCSWWLRLCRGGARSWRLIWVAIFRAVCWFWIAGEWRRSGAR